MSRNRERGDQVEARMPVRPPPFMETAVSGWFAIINAQFHLANISDSVTKVLPCAIFVASRRRRKGWSDGYRGAGFCSSQGGCHWDVRKNQTRTFRKTDLKECDDRTPVRILRWPKRCCVKSRSWRWPRQAQIYPISSPGHEHGSGRSTRSHALSDGKTSWWTRTSCAKTVSNCSRPSCRESTLRFSPASARNVPSRARSSTPISWPTSWPETYREGTCSWVILWGSTA